MASHNHLALVVSALLAWPAAAQFKSESVCADGDCQIALDNSLGAKKSRELEKAKIRLEEATIMAAEDFIAGKPVKASVREPEFREIEKIVGPELFSAFAKNMAEKEPLCADVHPE